MVTGELSRRATKSARMKEPKADIERFDDGAARQEGCHDNEGDGDEVKGQQAVAEPVRADALALVEVAQGLQAVGGATPRSRQGAPAAAVFTVDRPGVRLHGRRRGAATGCVPIPPLRKSVECT